MRAGTILSEAHPTVAGHHCLYSVHGVNYQPEQGGALRSKKPIHLETNQLRGPYLLALSKRNAAELHDARKNNRPAKIHLTHRELVMNWKYRHAMRGMGIWDDIKSGLSSAGNAIGDAGKALYKHVAKPVSEYAYKNVVNPIADYFNGEENHDSLSSLKKYASSAKDTLSKYANSGKKAIEKHTGLGSNKNSIERWIDKFDGGALPGFHGHVRTYDRDGRMRGGMHTLGGGIRIGGAIGGVSPFIARANQAAQASNGIVLSGNYSFIGNH